MGVQYFTFFKPYKSCQIAQRIIYVACTLLLLCSFVFTVKVLFSYLSRPASFFSHGQSYKKIISIIRFLYKLGLRIRSSIRSSLQEVFYKKCVLRNFAKFTGKRLCQSLFLIKFLKRDSGTEAFL